MDQSLFLLIAFLTGGILPFAYNYLTKKGKETSQKPSTLKPTQVDSDPRAREIIIEAKDEALRIKREAEEETRKISDQALQLEERIAAREESIEKKLTEISTKEKYLGEKTEELEKTRGELVSKLEKVAGVTREEAKKLILDATESKLKDEVARRIKESEEQIKREADEKAKNILVEAMQRGATDYVAEYTTSTVKLSDEDMKGRIIGREGRNIRAFEQAAGVDVDLDEIPGSIRLSSFDGERREIAKVSLERLMADGRIQPARIEEIVERTKREFEKIRREEGEKLCNAVGINGLPAELIETLGRFKWRYSYGQNLMIHTIEETKIGIGIAKELGLDVNKVKLGCLFHDIGKVFTPEAEGTHVQVGADYLRKFAIPSDIINIVEEHHEDKPFSFLESVVVWIADAISGSRPGARHEAIEDYMRRVKELENIASSFQGVEKSYAIAAGREVRVVVIPEQVDDAVLTKLAHDISEKIRSNVTYPGQVKVTVIRETRAVDVAK